MDVQNQHSQFPHYKLKNKFCYDMSVSSKRNSRVQRGLIGGQFVVQKIITCDEERQLFYRNILIERDQTRIKQKMEICFNSKISVQIETYKQGQQTKTAFLIFSPYVTASQLVRYTISRPFYRGDQISLEEKSDRILKVTKRAITQLMIHSNKQLYSYQTFLFDEIQDQNVVINPTSFVGMPLMLNNEELSERDFLQIYQILGSDTLEKQPDQRFTLQLKFRSLGIILLSLMFQKRFHIFINKTLWQSKEKLGYWKVYQQMLIDSKKAFERMFKMQKIVQKIQIMQLKHHVNYLDFLKRVFVNEEKLKWSDVVDMLIPKINKNACTHHPNLQITNLAQQLYDRQIMHSKLIMNQMGLNEIKFYLIALLHHENIPTEPMLGYEDLNDYLLATQSFNPNSMTIFVKLVKMIQQLSDNRTSQFIHQLLEQSPPFKTVIKYLEEDEELQKKYQALGTIREIDQLRYMTKIVKKYGIYQAKVKQKYLISQKDKNLSIKKYQKLFS